MRAKLSQAFWTLRADAKELLLRLVFAVPLSVGDRLRIAVLSRFLAELGEGTVIRDGIRISNPEKVRIGANCNIATGAVIKGGGGVTLGDFVGLGPDCKIWSVNHRYQDPDTPWLKQGYERVPVVIEDDVWVGANCFVMPGCTIGRGAIISAGTVLMKSVPAYALVAGNPGRVVGWRKRPEASAGERPDPTMANDVAAINTAPPQ